MKKVLIGLIVVALVCFFGSWTLAESKTDINKLIQQLGADDGQTRDAVQKELTELGKKLIEQYRIAEKDKKQTTRDKLKAEIKQFAEVLCQGCQDKDLEIRTRSNQIRQHLYVRTGPRIVFASFRNNILDIYVMDADGKNLKGLTKNKTFDRTPAWSPGGTSIPGPAWSPDGTKIVFVSQDNIYVIDADGESLKRLTENKVSTGPAWSPDGTKIVFSSQQDSNWDIYVMDADGKNLKRLTENKTDDDYPKCPVWSPDGTKLVFVAFRDGNGGKIYVMDADSTNERCLTSGSRPKWSPDGTKIVFQQATKRDGKWRFYVSIMDADGKNLKRLTDNKVVTKPAWPAWSPDGTKIAFASPVLSARGPLDQIYVMDADGKHLKRLTKNEAIDHAPAWSPDGTKIVFGSMPIFPSRIPPGRIYVIDADGKNQKRLTENETEAYDHAPAWSPACLAEISVLFRSED